MSQSNAQEDQKLQSLRVDVMCPCASTISAVIGVFSRGSVHKTLQNISRTLHIKAPWGIHRPDVPGLFPAEGAEAPADFGIADWDAVQIRTKVHDSAKK